jgi:hypothetical protein
MAGMKNKGTNQLMAGMMMLVLIFTSSGSVAQGAAPASGTIPYSGRLSNDAGQTVADGAYAFSFTLYDAAVDGNLLWSETQTGIALKDGAFSVRLGSVTPLPAQARIQTGWLSVGVRGPEEVEFTALEPRQRVDTSAPAVSASTTAPSEPNADTCAHTHFGESWASNSSGSAAGAGLAVQDNKVSGTGIEGIANHGTAAWGVSGESEHGSGVYGSSSDGFAFGADGNAFQARDKGGWVKAMAFVSGETITRCYNSQLGGVAATTPPCGITSTGSFADYTIDFGFQVDDRFITITAEWNNYTDGTGWVRSFPTSNSVWVRLSQITAFYIIVY